MAADDMHLETWTRGVATSITIPKQDILAAKKDFEKIDLPVESTSCDSSDHGTIVTLSHLNQNLSFPNPEILRQLLMLEYGREIDFKVYVNGDLLDIEDIPGKSFTEEVSLPDVGTVKLRFIIADDMKKLKNTGIVVRVGGKTVGKPGYFGLDNSEDIPSKLLKKVYGEIEADGLADDVTADWGAIIKNSKAFQVVEEWVQPHLRQGLKKVYSSEMNLAKARLEKQFQLRLAALPEYRREYAKKALERVMHKFYGENEDRRATVANVVLDALERDEYWQVMHKIEQARHRDVETFAEALGSFGLVEIAVMAQQATNRMRFLDHLEELIRNKDTHEMTVHKALENSLWALGEEYSLLTSNKTLARTIDEHLNKKFTGERAQKRPDLLLADLPQDKMLLIEFKRPSHTLNRDDKNQAEKYRDDLLPVFSKRIDILVLGGRRKEGLPVAPDNGYTKLVSYADVVSSARNRLEWLVKELLK